MAKNKANKEQTFGYPAWANNVVGNLDIKVDEISPNELHVTLWDSNRKKDWQGRIFPVVDVTVTREAPTRTIRRGFLGLGGRLTFTFNPTDHALSLKQG